MVLQTDNTSGTCGRRKIFTVHLLTRSLPRLTSEYMSMLTRRREVDQGDGRGPQGWTKDVCAKVDPNRRSTRGRGGRRRKTYTRPPRRTPGPKSRDLNRDLDVDPLGFGSAVTQDQRLGTSSPGVQHEARTGLSTRDTRQRLEDLQKIFGFC